MHWKEGKKVNYSAIDRLKGLVILEKKWLKWLCCLAMESIVIVFIVVQNGHTGGRGEKPAVREKGEAATFKYGDNAVRIFRVCPGRHASCCTRLHTWKVTEIAEESLREKFKPWLLSHLTNHSVKWVWMLVSESYGNGEKGFWSYLTFQQEVLLKPTDSVSLNLKIQFPFPLPLTP